MKSASQKSVEVDVAVVGGGPAGATTAALLRKYAPGTSVLVIEREQFPREKIGESQLPRVSAILNEIEAWDAVEAANFPIKIGAVYTWGADEDTWDFNFIPPAEFEHEERPAAFGGQRRHTAFQVERAVYDHILLEHARRHWGVQVWEGEAVGEVVCSGDRVTSLRLASGKEVRARAYVDASGGTGIVRRALDVAIMIPDELKNVAVWDHLDDVRWAEEVGVGGTRVHVRSLPYGWVWFIPIRPQRASVGVVCPSRYLVESGLSPQELHARAIRDQPQIRSLVSSAVSATGGNVRSARNWSHLADRLVGENWWLVGEAAGFADPILSAGLTLAHESARHAAYSILELWRSDLPPNWLRANYDRRNRSNILQHIRFAKYWYAANSRFTDLKEHCGLIAREAGLPYGPKEAWRWLSLGGFSNQSLESPGFGAFDLGGAKALVEQFSGEEVVFRIEEVNSLRLDLSSSKTTYEGQLHEGRIRRVPCYERNGARLPRVGLWALVLGVLEEETDLRAVVALLSDRLPLPRQGRVHEITLFKCVQVLEAMLLEGWLQGSLVKDRPRLRIYVGGRPRTRGFASPSRDSDSANGRFFEFVS